MEVSPIWFHANGLVINTEKTTGMLFHTWQNKFSYNLKPDLMIRILSTNMKPNFCVYI
jgi:hypothetical protein